MGRILNWGEQCETTPKTYSRHKNLPHPLKQSDLRRLMALLSQVAYCYATSPATEPLKHLLKPATIWNCSDDIDEAFKEVGKVIANKLKEGVRLFNPKLPTGCCLTGAKKAWATFYAKNIAIARTRMISTAVHKAGRYAALAAGSATKLSLTTPLQKESSQP